MNNNDKDKVVPLIVNGEINDGRNKKIKKVKEEKLPTKRFNFTDFILCVLGVILIIYGVNSIINKPAEKEEEKEVSSNSNVVEKKDENNYEEYFSFDAAELTNIYSPEDITAMANRLSIENLSNNAKLSLAARITVDNNYILESDLDKSAKELFGNVSYTKDGFTYGNRVYIYNSETGRYYLKNIDSNIKVSYLVYNYMETDKSDNGMVIRDYILYTDNTKKWTINNDIVDNSINKTTMKDNKSKLRYFEYTFVKDNDEYHLTSISIK